MDNKIIASIAAIFIAIVIVGSVMAPALSMAEQKQPIITQTNTSAIGIRFAQQTSDFNLDMSVSMDDQGNIIVLNGTDSQTKPYDTMFLMAADNSAIYAGDGGLIAIWTSGGDNYVQAIDDDFTVQLGESNIEIVKGGDTYTLPLPTSYLFVPSSTGYFTSYTDGGLDKLAADPVVAISEVFAGVIAYNDISVGGTVTEQITGTTTYTDNVEWGAAAAPELEQLNFDPSQIQFEPIIIDPFQPGNMIMSVPTPDYTDGVWGYNLSGSDATIVSYSGAGGDVITIPSTVGGYSVKGVGIDQSDQTVFDTSITATGLIISEGIEIIGKSAFKDCSGLTGTLVLPSTMKDLGNSCFSGCSGFTGTLVIPESVENIANGSFNGCSGFTGFIMYGNPTTPNSYYLFNMDNVTQVLDLGGYDFSNHVTGLPAAAEVQDHLDAACYLGHMTEVAVSPGAYNSILAVIPAVVIVAILLAIVGMMLLRRE